MLDCGSSASQRLVVGLADRYLTMYTITVLIVAACSSLLGFFSVVGIYQMLLVGSLLLLVGRRAVLFHQLRTLAFLFVLNLILILIASIIFNEDPAAIITVIGRYWGPILYSSILFAIGFRQSQLYFKTWYWLLLILTAVAFFQYFYSPTLWGLIPDEHSKISEGTESLSFNQYAVWYRASSLLGSPQVWGLYSALSIFILSISLRGGISIPVQIFLWSGCLLSGNKISAIIMVTFLLVRTFQQGGFLILSVFVGSVAFMFHGSEEISNFRVIEHVFSFGEIAAQEKEGRLTIWRFILGDINIFFGGGASYINNLSALRNFVAESYILQSWSEVTVLFPLIFLFIWFRQFVRGTPGFEQRIFLLNVLAGVTVSHAFLHPAFVVFWPFLLGMKSERK